MANLFLPQLITWFRLDEHVKRLKGRVDELEANPSNPTLQQVTTAGNTSSNDIQIVQSNTPKRLTVRTSGFNDRSTGLDSTTGLFMTNNTGTTTLSIGNNTTDRVLDLPDEDGTLIVDAPADAQNYVRNNNTWAVAAGGASQLEKLNEGNGDGYRILGKDPLLYGNIGLNAVDLSEADLGTTGALGLRSFAEGYNTTASGQNSHAEGRDTIASSFQAHAEGKGTTANGLFSHAEGQGTISSGQASHAEGATNTASGNFSHAQGQTTSATSDMAHSEGYETQATGIASHVEGWQSIASGDRSHAGGTNTRANSFSETAVGIFGVNTAPNSATSFNAADKVFGVGNGTSDGSRSDAFVVFKNGRSQFFGPAQLKNYTVATLPVGVVGDTAYVTDATAPTYLGALVGGGAVVCPVFYNGTAWVSH